MSIMTDLYAADLSGATWRKSSYTAGNGQCVEVADIPNTDGTAVRDSKNPHLPAARVSRAAWQLFVSAAARGEFES
ncbi:DUF397 domain-containing protein [Streptomyces albus]|uniref:DUF397 domain-containing protein n=1 Tax=Streptomyces TaxID=1883 RepID=UPI00034E98F4|nr:MULTISPECIES: DUF397 domain-containing protein [Streptomyces]EPD90551.1 hypothetical protein HMPREF1486_05912 [Streptomyces sp. HPH0547]KPC94633.1 hypothetical protein ADL27_13785 [Streptomyces sp. NRRL F-6602]QID36657.1 DUF397 domain-containing protein [Streptomyces albus]GHJ22357.1 hypothetical protein TPA0909_39710 [Streptomyces albus]